MSIKGVGNEIFVPKPEPKIDKKVESPKTEQPQVTADTTRIGDKVFAGSIIKEALNRAFDVGAKAGMTALKQPLDYFEIDKQADELISKHTDDHWYGDNLQTGDLGKELAELAKTDPERAAALTDNILDKIDGGDKDDLAKSIVDSMSPEDLRKFAATDKGKATLDQLKHHLDEGWTTDDEDTSLRKIDTAVKAAELEKSAEFKSLDPATQKEVLARLDSSATNTAAVDNLITLAKDGNFRAASPETQKNLLGAFDNHKEDAVFTKTLISLAGNPDFRALNSTDQNKVLTDLDKFTKTESYHDHGGFLGIGKTNVTDEDRQFLLDNLGKTAIYSAANPGAVSVRNTLDKIVNGDVKIETYSKPSDPVTGGTNHGYTYSEGTVYMNKHPDANNDAVWGDNKFTDTLVHEMNHQLNPGGEQGTPDQFLNEYRAFYTGYAAIGQPQDAAALRDNINNLISDNYPDIKEQYDTNPKFKKFIDDTLAGFNQTPPLLLDPEAMRQSLLDAGFSSDYLNKSANIDNH